MRLQRTATVAGLAALVQAGGDRRQLGTGTAASSTYWVTTVVPTYTTYCPVSCSACSPTCWCRPTDVSLVPNYLGLPEYHLLYHVRDHHHAAYVVSPLLLLLFTNPASLTVC